MDASNTFDAVENGLNRKKEEVHPRPKPVQEYAGRVAKLLDSELSVPLENFDSTGVISMHAVVKATVNPVDAVSDTAWVQKDKEEQDSLLAESDKKNAEDNERYQALVELDKKALRTKLMKNVGREEFKKHVILAEETIVAELPVVAFKGLVTPAGEMKVGSGLLLCTEYGNQADASLGHRLHFYIEDHKSTFDAKQQFSQETLNGDWYERSATQTANSKHTASGTFASTFVETNLLHIHSEVEEISKYAHKIYGHEAQHLEENKDKPGGPACACCSCFKTPSCKEVCKCACKKWCSTCDWPCCDLSCICVCQKSECCKGKPAKKAENTYESLKRLWNMTVSSRSNSDEDQLERLLVNVWESEKQDAHCKLPFQEMDRGIDESTEQEASHVRSSSVVHMTIRNSSNNNIEAVKAILSPATELQEIIKFESIVHRHSIQASWVKNHDDKSSWNTMGFEGKKSMFTA